jgi:two-component system response regulator QseB
MTEVLLVEDDRRLAEHLQRVLTGEGYTVTAAEDGQRALHLGLTRTFDLIVLDRGLPAIEGLDLLGRLRRSGVAAPVLVLSARATTQDRVEGLDTGAQDYLAKPFEVDELLARLRALLRRPGPSGSHLALGDRSVLDCDSRVVRLTDDRVVELSEREADLMALLARSPKQVFSRADLLLRVFPDAESETVVDTYVHYCRRKLGKSSIRTVRGRGFCLGTVA